MGKTYGNIQSLPVAEQALGVVERRITELRLSQSSARDKVEWYRIKIQLDELESERRSLNRQIAKLEVSAHSQRKDIKVRNARKFDGVYE